MKALFLSLAISTHPEPAALDHPDTVIVLHGMGRTRASMGPIASHLRREGFRVVCETYPYRGRTIERIAEEWLAPRVEQAAAAGGRVHFVTHSLGGIVVRQYLSLHRPAALGRVVMLAPPNQGSELSDRLRRLAPARWWNGPALSQLGTDAASLPLRLGPVDYPCGIIAGTVSLNPLFSLLLDGPDDGKVAVSHTHVAGESDHLEVPFSHTWLMWRRETQRAVTRFLRKGTFRPEG